MPNLIGKLFGTPKEDEALVSFVREGIASADANACSLEIHLPENTPLSSALEEICTMGHFPEDPSIIWEIRVRSRINGALVARIVFDADKMRPVFAMIVEDFPISSIEELHLEARVAEPEQ